MTGTAPRQKLFILICLVLAFGTAVLFWPVTHHPFITLDDQQYVTQNSHVQSGLTWGGVKWAFSNFEAANWHPLTWLAHQLDCTLFGLDAGGHHLVNVLLHTTNALLVFLLLRGATGALWRSGIVAALFAWHPLRVESVAWAAERKDVLCAFFFLLSLLFYLNWKKRDACSVTSENNFPPPAALVTRRKFFWLSWLAFACALMSKPMAVTLPFILLLLDVWPLGRIQNEKLKIKTGISLLVEKIPFFALTFTSCLATFLVQRGGGAVSSVELPIRLANVPVTYARYISKTFWPENLSLVYPYVYHWPWLALVGSGLLVVVVTLLALLVLRSRPWLATGWLWFLGTLVPTIGFVQVGAQSMADRYTYLPGVGLLIVVVWGVAEMFSKPARGKIFSTALASAALLGCVLVTPLQLAHWRDSISLFRHALAVTTDNYVAANCLGKAYEKNGDAAHALVLYRSAVEVEPRFPQSQLNYAMMLLAFGNESEALTHLQAAAALEPRNADVQFNLGIFFSKHQDWTKAVNCFSNAVLVRPDFSRARAELDGLRAGHPELR